MPANVYECMFILDSSKVAGNLETADKQLRGILEKHNAEVLVSRVWDERKFSYPIRNQKKGIYYLTYFSSEGKNLVAIEHDCLTQRNDSALDYSENPSKAVDTMLALAKGEHAVALHNMQEEPTGEEGPIEEVGVDGGHGPRRPRRNEPRD